MHLVDIIDIKYVIILITIQLDTNTLVVLRHPKDKYLRIAPKNLQQLDENGGTGQYARWYIELHEEQNGFRIIKLRHNKTNKYLRIYNNGSTIDCAGTG